MIIRYSSKYLKLSLLIFVIFLILPVVISFSQETKQPPPKEENTPAEAALIPTPETTALASPEKETDYEATLSKSDTVTLDFKEADILNVLKIISYKAGVNIVPTPEVMGNVTIRLVDVPWEQALDVILKTYGFGYQKQGNIILVTKLENISKIQAEEPLQTEIIRLKYLDAQDAQKVIAPLLSPRGKISVLYARGQKGWQFGTFKIGKERVTGVMMEREQAGQTKPETISLDKTPSGEIISRKAEFESSIKSKTLVITDTPATLDRVRTVILPQIDKMIKQVLIEAKLMEVNRDKLRDLGLDWGLGSTTSAESAGVTTQSMTKNTMLGGQSIGSQISPAVFGPKEGVSVITGKYPYQAGSQFLFQKLTGTKFEVILHALEEDVHTNILSAPRVLTIDNQEASILVGYHTPILKAEISTDQATGGSKIIQTLDYYQEIGIRLNVVPQINDEGYINMIIHPSITSSTSSVAASSFVGNATNTITYPVIDVRETQTQVLIKDGETIVIGGLLKDIKSKETIGVPFFSKIPLLGGLFRRDTYDTQKIDLLMFITARVIKEAEFTPEEIAKLEKRMQGNGSNEKIKKEKEPKEKTSK